MDFRIENLLQDQTLDEESETNERNEARSQFTDGQNSLISTATNVALGIASVAAVSTTGLYMMREYLAFPCVTGVWFMGRRLDKVRTTIVKSQNHQVFEHRTLTLSTHI
uniref:Uncharacterized protein n=1 Tax=Romanomermis culicivorax TaxID=13658 RepID=A0A915L4U0_ROMCU